MSSSPPHVSTKPLLSSPTPSPRNGQQQQHSTIITPTKMTSSLSSPSISSPYKENNNNKNCSSCSFLGCNTSRFWWYAIGFGAIITISICQLDLSIVSTTTTTTTTTTTGNSSPATNIRTSSSSSLLFSTSSSSTKQQKPRSIKQISILGERNSGTRWTFRHLTECFNHSIPVKTKLTRYKHWFQYPEGGIQGRYPHDTLVIAQFRNPYEWLKAMQHVPHHSPNHLKYRDDKYWKEFLTSTWSMDRIGTDITQKSNYTSSKLLGTKPCQEHFEYNQIISCDVEPIPKSSYKTLHYSEHQPFYEMQNFNDIKITKDIPYNNIMELRTDKIRNFLSIKDYIGIADVWIIQYEYLVTKGTKDLIDQISNWTGIKPQCTYSPPQQRASRPVEKEMAEFIRTNLNWTVESWIGYGPHE